MCNVGSDLAQGSFSLVVAESLLDIPWDLLNRRQGLQLLSLAERWLLAAATLERTVKISAGSELSNLLGASHDIDSLLTEWGYPPIGTPVVTRSTGPHELGTNDPTALTREGLRRKLQFAISQLQSTVEEQKLQFPEAL